MCLFNNDLFEGDHTKSTKEENITKKRRREWRELAMSN
jgi:hypothetical protein